jgi:hypothetical protein
VSQENDNNKLLNRIEIVSGEIQLLALNIAVAAAKMAHKQELGLEVNQSLSQLVNEATQAVKHMNQILSAASADKSKGGQNEHKTVDRELLEEIESSMNSIISDSEKITRILSGIKKG